MQIKTAETAGFCFGVDRAVGMAYKLSESGARCRTLGPLIHNTEVINDLLNKGIGIIDTPEEAEKGEIVIIRAHGVVPESCDVIVNKGAEICDATCPFVKKIHNIVSDNSSSDIPVLIAGDHSHPEVTGIRGYCKGETYIFSSLEDLNEIFNSHPEFFKNRIIAVSQTTFSEDEWKKCKEKLKFYCTNVKIFDTICSATRKRQEEAEKLSSECDAMIVIGSKHSSNTFKLFNVCSNNADTFLVERAEELKNIDFSTYARVGVTAGASTPAVIIKEVLLAMSEIINETTNNQVEEVPSAVASVDSENFEAMLDENFNDDSVVKCIVEAINATEVKVSLPGNHVLGGLTGLVSNDEYSADPTVDPSKELKVGDEINLVIMKKNDAEGTVMLSKKRFDSQNSWNDIVEAKESEAILEGTVIGAIKGGILVSYKGSTVFVPASLATASKDDSVEELIKQTVKFRIIDVDTRRRRAVGSIRSVLGEMKKAAADAFWADAEEGKVYNGVVKSMTNFGAFVDIGGVDGMVHISEMSWKRIKHPSDLFEIGQKVQVYIKTLDRENRRIGLGYRKDEDNPWVILKNNYPEGTVLECEIVSVASFGAFAKVIPGIDGLIHISQISNQRIEKTADVLSIGQKVTCKITAIDFDKKRVSLSMRALIEEDDSSEDEFEEDAAESVVEEAAEEATDAE